MEEHRSHQQEQILSRYQHALEEICDSRNRDVYIEIETRIGSIIDPIKDSFLPGIKREEFYCLKNYMESLEYFANKMSTEYNLELIYKYERDNYRKVYNGETKEFIRWERKTKAKRDNFVITNENDYCIRLTSAHEQGIEDNMISVVESEGQHVCTRHKWRTIYDINPHYMIHLTRVYQETLVRNKNNMYNANGRNSFGNNTNDEKRIEKKISYEIEVEFKSEAIKQIGEDDLQIRECIRNYLGEIKFLLDIIKKSHGNYFDDVIQSENMERRNCYQLSKFILDTIEGAGFNARMFPGAMPVNFGRISFDVIQKNDYIISEKTDGVRHFVLITESHVYLVTRAMEFYIVDYKGLVESVGKKGISLFDAEIVRNIQTMRPVLMLFDAMVVDGMNITKLKYSERLEYIKEIVERVKSYDEQEYQENEDFKETPFDIITKVFFKKEEINNLFKMISFNDQVGSYIIQDTLRYHRSDGIIFAPDIEYLPFANSGLYKWKYMTHWTIDYGINPDLHEKGVFYCADGRDIEIPLREVNFNSQDKEQLEKDKEYYRINKPVVETSYDVWRGEWKYHLLRYDKPRPNHISVCIDTLEAMSCNISREELIYRCSVPPEEDHWDELYNQALQNQIRNEIEERRKKEEQQKQQYYNNLMQN